MIPKTIHYCWFGHGKKTRVVKKCLKSWKKHLPDYRIIEWNEDNYDISSAPLFVRQAFASGAWAFATDYIRYDVVYAHGGIYFDTDVEVLKSLDPFLGDKAFFGVQFYGERYEKQVASGLGFGAEKGAPILRELMGSYESIPFIKPNGHFDRTPCPKRDAPVFERHGYLQAGREQILEGGVHIYPPEFFCPYSPVGRIMRKTGNTVSIHWFETGWYTRREHWERRASCILSEEQIKRLKDVLRKFLRRSPCP